MHTAYFSGIRATTSSHVSQLTWHSPKWNESMSKGSLKKKTELVNTRGKSCSPNYV